MFRYIVNTIFRVTDSFSHEVIANGIFTAFLDGERVKLLSKGDGYFLLMNAPYGEHEIEFISGIYLREKLKINVSGKAETIAMALKPGEHYPYGSGTKVFEGEADGEYAWIAPVKRGWELKIAENESAGGAEEISVFSPASFAGHAYPDNFLISDGDKSEVVCIERVEDGKARLISGLANPHKRGTRLVPAVRFGLEEGRYRAVFKDAESIEVLCGKNLFQQV
ncbi:hypothetical protein QYZ88_018080 [Lachnospiraceae bacterium C1.1]|nr:hypothetical protein [Lachnospiraceae bacterium C1.1]